MDKKVWIALLLSMAVLLLYPYFIQRFYPKAAAPKKAETTAPAGQAAPQAGLPGAQAAQAPAAPVAHEELTVVETPLFKATFTSNGGGIKTMELKKYKQEMKEPSKPVNVASNVAILDSFKTQVDVNNAPEVISFRPSTAAINIKDGEKAELAYTGASSNGLVFEKKYTFSGDTYFISTELKAANPTAAAISSKSETVLAANIAGKDAAGYHQGPLIKTKDKLLRQSPGDAKLSASDNLKWIGLEDKYFLSALIPAQAVSWAAEAPSASSSSVAMQFPLNIAPNGTVKYTYGSFLGPKEYDRLVKQKAGLEEAIQFGWADWLAKPFLVALNFFEKYLKNYGIAIIVLTGIIKVLFYPLTKKSLQSMREMQRMQPQLAALKEKYKNDKEKMNKELMELYKRYKINPLGGCLPMVLQIPVFIALYEVLYVAIELRHAPFFLWIHDLSAKDPYYITPLLMGASMFMQQKMTPSSVDPAQQKMMMFMPIIFTFMFLSLPSGLVLYWLVNNILSIGQQYFINKTPVKAKA